MSDTNPTPTAASTKAASTPANKAGASKAEPRSARIKDKIAASQDRLKRDGAAAPKSAEKKHAPVRSSAKPAPTTTQSLRATAAEYPFLTIVGGIAAGAVLYSLLPKAFARKLAKRSVALATVAGELGMVYGKSALDKAGELGHDAQERIGDAVKSLDENTADARSRAGELAGEAGARAAQIAGDAFSATRETGSKVAETTRDVGLDFARKLLKLAVDARRR